MTIIQTKDLTGAQLDWAVAKCDGVEVGICLGGYLATKRQIEMTPYSCSGYEPSTNWGIGGPIIEREQMTITSPGSTVHRHGGPNAGWGPSGIWGATTWHKGVNGRRSIAHHETSPLIAAMRCYVLSKLGEEVDVPQELAKKGGAA